jgi:predicted TPR repeat methyltransferase
LNVTGRYSHTEAYLRRLAAENGFRIERHLTIECRLERGVPVEGWLAVWRPTA